MFTVEAEWVSRGNRFILKKFAAVGQFFPRGYTGTARRERFGEAEVKGLEQSTRVGVGAGDAQAASTQFQLKSEIPD